MLRPLADQYAVEGTQSRQTAHRFSYSVEDTSCPKVEGLMARSSRSLYMLCLKRKSSNLWAGKGACEPCNSNCTRNSYVRGSSLGRAVQPCSTIKVKSKRSSTPRQRCRCVQQNTLGRLSIAVPL